MKYVAQYEPDVGVSKTGNTVQIFHSGLTRQRFAELEKKCLAYDNVKYVQFFYDVT